MEEIVIPGKEGEDTRNLQGQLPDLRKGSKRYLLAQLDTKSFGFQVAEKLN